MHAATSSASSASRSRTPPGAGGWSATTCRSTSLSWTASWSAQLHSCLARNPPASARSESWVRRRTRRSSCWPTPPVPNSTRRPSTPTPHRHSKPPADFVTRTVATIGDVEYPGYHGVGRRDAMITDEDRKALAYFRAHPRGVRAADLSATQRGHFDELLARFVHRARPGLVGFEMDRIAAAGGVGELHFAWAGGASIDQPHYFRIH